MRKIQSDISDIKSNQQIIIGEFAGFEIKFAEVLNTLEKIAKNVDNPKKVRSGATADVQHETVTCYLSPFLI